MRIIVTGGAGFIGSAVVRHLVNDVGAEVLTIDKLTYAGNISNLEAVAGRGCHRFVKADICDRATVETLFESFKPTRVYHLAAESHVDRSIGGAEEFVATNIVGTFSLLEAARRYWMALTGSAKDEFRFLHVSTDEVYGSLGAGRLSDETAPYDPSSPYSASKAASDHLVIAWARTYGFPALVSNCSNNYGPFQFPDKLVPLVILNALHGRSLPVYGDGSHIRDWLYVEDHARALHTIAGRGRIGEKYNVGGRNERRNIDVVRAICAILDSHAGKSAPYSDLITFVSDRPGHDVRYAVDATKLEVELAWHARESFDTGLAKTVRWYLANEAWWRPLRENVYGGERLGVIAQGDPISSSAGY